ncbi:unnamed protein product [Pedinophyceae sp. YPF-701]|nr:unnamed protein product [Pedinophyceae sp. YPF-701]
MPQNAAERRPHTANKVRERILLASQREANLRMESELAAFDLEVARHERQEALAKLERTRERLRKVEADAAALRTEVERERANPLNARLNEVESALHAERERNADLSLRVEDLEARLRDSEERRVAAEAQLREDRAAAAGEARARAAAGGGQGGAGGASQQASVPTEALRHLQQQVAELRGALGQAEAAGRLLAREGVQPGGAEEVRAKEADRRAAVVDRRMRAIEAAVRSMGLLAGGLGGGGSKGRRSPHVAWDGRGRLGLTQSAVGDGDDEGDGWAEGPEDVDDAPPRGWGGSIGQHPGGLNASYGAASGSRPRSQRHSRSPGGRHNRSQAAPSAARATPGEFIDTGSRGASLNASLRQGRGAAPARTVEDAGIPGYLFHPELGLIPESSLEAQQMAQQQFAAAHTQAPRRTSRREHEQPSASGFHNEPQHRPLRSSQASLRPRTASAYGSRPASPPASPPQPPPAPPAPAAIPAPAPNPPLAAYAPPAQQWAPPPPRAKRRKGELATPPNRMREEDLQQARVEYFAERQRIMQRVEAEARQQAGQV